MNYSLVVAPGFDGDGDPKSNAVEQAIAENITLITDFEILRDWTCFDADTGKDLAVKVREYFIPDFSNWKDHDAFESAFARLKKDLEAEI